MQAVVTFGVPLTRARGATLWRSLYETATTPVVAIDCPPEPWIAARLELGVGQASEDAMMMIGDLERVIGGSFWSGWDGEG